jgi:hypothetical protein
MTQIPDDPFEQHFPGGFTIRDEANALVAWAFRNGPLEDLHAGKYSPLLEDPDLSRISDAEMKTLMLNACCQLAKLLESSRTTFAIVQSGSGRDSDAAHARPPGFELLQRV